jgi:hypothetical protein
MGIFGNRFIQIRHISGVVFIVMDLHRLSVNMRFKGVKRIWQRRQRVRAAGGACGLSVRDAQGPRCCVCDRCQHSCFQDLSSSHHNEIPF